MSLDGVVQAPGGQREDADGGFERGGWSIPFFDPDAMGPVIDEVVRSGGPWHSASLTAEAPSGSATAVVATC